LKALFGALKDNAIRDLYTPAKWEALILQSFDLVAAFRTG
jgi:hypothetical protein